MAEGEGYQYPGEKSPPVLAHMIRYKLQQKTQKLFCYNIKQDYLIRAGEEGELLPGRLYEENGRFFFIVTSGRAGPDGSWERRDDDNLDKKGGGEV